MIPMMCFRFAKLHRTTYSMHITIKHITYQKSAKINNKAEKIKLKANKRNSNPYLKMCRLKISIEKNLMCEIYLIVMSDENCLILYYSYE